MSDRSPDRRTASGDGRVPLLPLAGWLALPLVAGALLGGGGGCSTPEEALSPAEWIEENSTVFDDLASYDDRERQDGIRRIKALGEEQGKAILFWLLSDPKLDDYRLEVVLARLLAEWKDYRAVPFLLESLRIHDDGARRIAEEGLLAFPDNPHVQEGLVRLLESDARGERLAAARILSKLGTQPAVEAMGRRIKLELDPEVRALLVIGVIGSKHPRRLEFLVDAMTDADPAIRELAWSAVRSHGGTPPVDFDPRGPDVDRAKAVGTLRVWLSRTPPRAR